MKLLEKDFNNCMSYKKKLLEFNSTEKYSKEMVYLFDKIDPQTNERILDYGCGIGTFIDHINLASKAKCFGYDKFVYTAKKSVRDSFSFQFDKVFFMHSIAHIENIDLTLTNLKNFLEHKSFIYVLTPNKNWLDLLDNPEYIPDITVVKHYSIETLTEAFESNGYNLIESEQFGEQKENQKERIYLKFRL